MILPYDNFRTEQQKEEYAVAAWIWERYGICNDKNGYFLTHYDNRNQVQMDTRYEPCSRKPSSIIKAAKKLGIL